MAIVYSYPLNNNIKPFDELVGTTEQSINGQSRTVTRNFQLQSLINFFSVSGLQKTLTLTTNNTSGAATLDPLTGILNIPNYSTGSLITPAALTKVDDTNVTLTLGGSPSNALLQGVSLTLGWTGTLADSRIASASVWNAKQNAITTGTNLQYLRGDLSLATFPTNISSFTNDSGYITNSALIPYITSAAAAATYEPKIIAGTTAQYWRGDKSWQTFPTIPTVGTWGTLNYPTWTTGTPFVKMTAVGTFALDTNTYLTANQNIALSGAVTGSGTTTITTTLSNSIVGIANLTATGTPSATTYLRGDNTWATITGSGSVTGVTATSPITSSGGTAPVISTSMATNRLIGRSSAGTGVMEEITIGTGLSLSAGVLTNTGGGSGGGSSVNYYLNGGTSQGIIGGVTYYEFSKTAVIGTGADFSRGTDGLIASFITDAADPSLLLIPGGNWNLEFFFSSSSAGGSPSFYVELYKYNGTTFTLITSNSTNPEGITGGTAIDAYFTPLAVPETVLTVNDRLAIRVFVNASSKTITLHTQNGHLCEVITTFTSGVTGTGTTNYISKFAGTTVIGNSQIFDDGTNIGIGTTLPTAKLEVLSTNFPVAKITRSTALTSALRSTFAAKHLTSGDMLDGFGPDVSFIIQDNSNVENEIANFGAVRDGLDNSGALIFSTRQSGVRYDRMKLFSDGRLALATDFAGVTSSPQYKLYVNGSQYLQNINQQLFLDDFNRTSVSPGGTPVIAYTLGSTGGSTATILSTQLRIPNSATTSIGYTYVTGSIPLSYNGDVVYNTILEKNIGLLTWSFNFRTGRSIALEGFAPGQFGLATILCTNSTDPQAVGAKGYAVYYINNQVFLVYFTDGLAAYSTVTAISPLGLTQDYYSARVTYDCGTAKWNLEVRNDGASAFSNPNSGIYVLQSGFVSPPTAPTPGISLPYFGWLWNFNTTTTAQSAFFDNFGFNILTGGSLIVDGNIGIGITSPNLSAKLDITSTTQGFLPPRMTTTQINAIASPAAGLVAYNTTLNVLCYRDNVGWKQVTSTVM